MTTYTVAIATWYCDSWHVDNSTMSGFVTEREAVNISQQWRKRGGFPLCMEYQNGIETRVLIEFEGKLTAAFGL